ncbi:hypothetical protein AAVH_16598 [Aphelenchoides avenae]|nr:hypothetical protein AAVH_16598 [Aphelenchus avenae]
MVVWCRTNLCNVANVKMLDTLLAFDIKVYDLRELLYACPIKPRVREAAARLQTSGDFSLYVAAYLERELNDAYHEYFYAMDPLPTDVIDDFLLHGRAIASIVQRCEDELAQGYRALY